MKNVIIQISDKFTSKSVYTITLHEQITVLRDLSGTGKTALSNLVNVIEGTDYICNLINAEYILAVTSEKAAIEYSKDTKHSIVFIIDEEFVDKCFKVFEPFLPFANWYILIITRDAELLATTNAKSMRLTTTADGNIVNVPVEKDATYYAGNFSHIDYIYTEDSDSGTDLYSAITMGKVKVNDGFTGTLGYGTLKNNLMETELRDYTVIIFDAPSFESVRSEVEGYIFNSCKLICLFVPIGTEWLLLHSDIFLNDTEVSMFLLQDTPSSGYISLEEQSLAILQRKGLGYKKSKGYINWRLLTKSSIHQIGEVLPHPFKRYIRDYQFIMNTYCNRNNLSHDIVDSYRQQILSLGVNVNISAWVKNIVYTHQEITTPEKFLVYIDSKLERRPVTEVIQNPDIIDVVEELGAGGSPYAFLSDMLGDSTLLTDAQILSMLKSISLGSASNKCIYSVSQDAETHYYIVSKSGIKEIINVYVDASDKFTALTQIDGTEQIDANRFASIEQQLDYESCEFNLDKDAITVIRADGALKVITNASTKTAQQIMGVIKC